MSRTGTEARRRGRGRRPAAEVRAAVLDAAGRLLLRDGLAAVTFERVALEAGSSKVTLYKWWPSPGALAAEAYFSRSEGLLEFPDSGDIRADLLAQLSSFVLLMTTGGAGRPVRELVGAAQRDAALRTAWEDSYVHPRREFARERLRRAVEQGQIAVRADIDVIVDQLWGACYHRMLVSGAPLSVELAERLVDQALYGAAAR